MSKEIKKIWTNGNSTCCPVIPRKVAQEHGLTEEDYVVVENTAEGILIRRVDV